MNNPEVDHLVSEGLAAHGAGRAENALTLFRQAQAVAPDNGMVQGLCGAVLLQLGRLDEARKEIFEAVDKSPQDGGLRVHRGAYHLRVGDIASAHADYETAVRLSPELAEAWSGLGGVNIKQGLYREASEQYAKALELNPSNFAIAMRLAQTRAVIGEYAGALSALDKAESLRPGAREVAAIRARVHFARRDWTALEAAARDQLSSNPQDINAKRYLAAAYFETGRYGAAQSLYKETLAGESRTADALQYYVELSMHASKFDEADEALDAAEALQADNPATHAARVLLRIYQGRLDDAEESCRKCLELNPAYTEVYPYLSVLRKGKLTDDEAQILRETVENEGAELDGRAKASFVLAHHLDATDDAPNAFLEYTRANRLSEERNKRDGFEFDAAGADNWITHIIKTFGGAPAERSERGDGPTPIFLVGLPRCGSTLVESVLSAHSKVAAGGERPQLPPIFNEWVRGNGGDGALSEKDKAAYREAYLAEAPDGAAFFTDKNLLNVEAVGLIAQLFPEAPIINVRRSPMECGLGIYRQDFLKFWTYTTSLKNIGVRYGHYAQLVRHWEGAYDDRFLTLQYEQFTDDFESEARRLIDFCKLDWEDACLDFQNAERVAATISATQVREPVVRRSSRAERYDKFLGPLRDALTKESVDLATGALVVH